MDIKQVNEWMDVRRVIHMNMKTHPKDGKRSSLGHSIGRWEGDTLVIETANYSAGVLNQYVEQPGQPTNGLLHSAALTTVERLHLDWELHGPATTVNSMSAVCIACAIRYRQPHSPTWRS